MPGLYVRDAGGVSRKCRELHEAQGGVDRKLREMYAGDGGGVSRKIFGEYDCQATVESRSFGGSSHIYANGSGVLCVQGSLSKTANTAGIKFTFKNPVYNWDGSCALTIASYSISNATIMQESGYGLMLLVNGVLKDACYNLASGDTVTFNFSSTEAYQYNLELGVYPKDTRQISSASLRWNSGGLIIGGHPITNVEIM